MLQAPLHIGSGDETPCQSPFLQHQPSYVQYNGHNLTRESLDQIRTLVLKKCEECLTGRLSQQDQQNFTLQNQKTFNKDHQQPSDLPSSKNEPMVQIMPSKITFRNRSDTNRLLKLKQHHQSGFNNTSNFETTSSFVYSPFNRASLPPPLMEERTTSPYPEACLLSPPLLLKPSLQTVMSRNVYGGGAGGSRNLSGKPQTITMINPNLFNS